MYWPTHRLEKLLFEFTMFDRGRCLVNQAKITHNNCSNKYPTCFCADLYRKQKQNCNTNISHAHRHIHIHHHRHQQFPKNKPKSIPEITTFDSLYNVCVCVCVYTNWFYSNTSTGRHHKLTFIWKIDSLGVEFPHDLFYLLHKIVYEINNEWCI